MAAQVLRFLLLSKLQRQSIQGNLDGWRVQEPLYVSSWKHLGGHYGLWMPLVLHWVRSLYLLHHRWWVPHSSKGRSCLKCSTGDPSSCVGGSVQSH